MNPNGPIIIVEDDPEEAMLLKELLNDISSSREVIVHTQSHTAIDFFSQCEDPFLILSGINLRGLNGFQLREGILSDKALARKCKPYVFYSAHCGQDMHEKVYELQASGYLHDINSYTELEQRLSLMVSYWEQHMA